MNYKHTRSGYLHSGEEIRYFYKYAFNKFFLMRQSSHISSIITTLKETYKFKKYV